MTLVAYARVSTDDQTTALSLDALNRAGAMQVFDEQASGGRWNRPELHAMLAYLRAGDSVVGWRIARLSRSLPDVVRIMERIDQRGAALKALTEPIDTTTAAGKTVMQRVGVFAGLERASLKERTHAGIRTAPAVDGGTTGGHCPASHCQRTHGCRRGPPLSSRPCRPQPPAP